jgi:hypothetical protein
MFKVRGGPIIAVAALILAVWLLANSTLREAVTAVIAAAVGMAIYSAYRIGARNNRRSGKVAD